MCGLNDALYGGEVHPALCSVIGYGGAAFGGKTEGMLGVALVALSEIPGVKIGWFRRTFPELEGSDGIIERSYSLFPKIGAKYNESKHIWRMSDTENEGDDWDKGKAGALRFCHLQYEKDIYAYQSSSFDIQLWDEATHFAWMQTRYMFTRNRMSKYSQIPRAFAVMCSNPGNIGHIWYKQIFGIKDRLKDSIENENEPITPALPHSTPATSPPTPTPP